MANIAQTQYVDYINNYGGKLDHFEQRGSDYAALRAFQEESNPSDPKSIITQDVWNDAKKSFGINVRVPVLDYFSPTMQTTRTCAFATEGVTSQKVLLTFNTYRTGFFMVPEDNYNNYVKYQNEWQRGFDGVIEKFGRALDSDCVNQLDLNKNTLWTNVAPGFYTQSGDALQVPNANKNDFYNQLSGIYQTMDYNSSDIKVISSPRHTPMVRYYSNQGSGNSINTNFQFGPYSYFPTNRVADTSGSESTVYSFPKGSVGMITRLDPSALNRSKVHEGEFWDVLPNVPVLNSMQSVGVSSPAKIDLGVHYKAKCDDPSALKAAALAGLTAAKIESWWFSFDVVFMTAFNSRATASPPTDYNPVLKSEILSA